MRMRAAWALVAVAAVALVVVVLVAGGGSGQDEQAEPASASQRKGDAGSDPDRARRKVSGPHDEPVPILMYHVIADPPASATYADLYVSEADFKDQIDELARRGYHGVTLDQVHDYWRSGYALPANPVVVSFDDGYASQYRNAFPVLRAHGWPGVVSIVTKDLKPSWGLHPDKVRKLIDAGWEIDSHSIHHLDVSTLDGAALEREIAGSRRLLRRRFGVPVNFFCYPSGRYDDAAIAAVKRAGFKGATTTEPGLARSGELYTLARVRVNRGDSGAGLAGTLRSLEG